MSATGTVASATEPVFATVIWNVTVSPMNAGFALVRVFVRV